LAQYVQITVKIGGSKVSPISYCSINQRIDWHHSFEILVPVDGFSKSNSNILNQAKDFIGKRIELAFKIMKPEVSNVQNEFFGIVTEVSLNRRNKGNKEVLIRGHSPTILLDGRPNCRSYSEKTLKAIVSDIHDQIPQDLKINIDPIFTGEIPYIVQYKESNFHFLNRLADKYGEWCYYDGKELNFGRITKTPKHNLPIDKNLSDFEFTLRVQNINYNVRTYDYMQNTAYLDKTKDFQVSDLDPYGNHALAQSEGIFKQINTYYSPGLFKDQQDFSDNNETKKIAFTKDLISSEGVSDNPYINVGSVINITGETKGEEDYGEFIILSINHSIDISGNYSNNFTAIPAQAKIPPVNKNISRPLSEMQPAVVKDNDDPEKLGRVKVQFFWQEQGDETPWLRILNAYGGKMDGGEQYGFYFIPEIGDEVLVGFENDNPDKAFIMGNVYHKNSSPDHWYNAYNNIKSVRTRNGNQIIFIDENGKEEIRILNKDDSSPTNEISLSLNNNGKITIKSVGDLEISAENIKISAQTDLTVESGQNTKLTASDYQLDATNGIKLTGQQITVEGQNTTTIKGQTKLELEGTNASMKGQAELKLEGTQTKIGATVLKMEGNAQAEIKGATVKVAGTAVTEVTGGLVKIN
jgi:Rhs element Vgr protein